MKWIFEKHPPMGGATGQAFNNALQGTRSPVDLLARETIQNSCDAAVSSSRPVRIVFRLHKASLTEKANILGCLDLMDSFAPRFERLGLEDENCLTQKLETELHSLYVEDYETCGIFGLPHSSDSHFHRLLLALGDDSKAFGVDSSGGSYGYGKSVYTFNSKIHTIVAYSVFADHGDGVTARLMGCSFFNRHSYEDKDYTGRAWFGEEGVEGVVDPFENGEAHRIAGQLGFATRDESQIGTTILILDTSVDMNDLRCFIEDSWWPRLIDHDVAISLFENDIALAHPRPKQREELRPFIDCYEMAVERSRPTGSHQRSKKLHSYQDKQLGSYGFQLLDPEKVNHEEFQPLANTVALIRSPKMVVNY